MVTPSIKALIDEWRTFTGDSAIDPAVSPEMVGVYQKCADELETVAAIESVFSHPSKMPPGWEPLHADPAADARPGVITKAGVDGDV